jgi:hypothetical protein
MLSMVVVAMVVTTMFTMMAMAMAVAAAGLPPPCFALRHAARRSKDELEVIESNLKFG